MPAQPSDISCALVRIDRLSVARVRTSSDSYQTLQFFAGAIAAPALQLNAAAKPG